MLDVSLVSALWTTKVTSLVILLTYIQQQVTSRALLRVGKVSHYFGWTGPGFTIDTACSASTVTIHQACRAIIHGECTAGLAGGSTVMTNPLWIYISQPYWSLQAF